MRAGRLGFIDLLPLLRVHREYFWHLFQPDRLSGEMKHFAGRQFVIFFTLLVTGKGCAILFSRAGCRPCCPEPLEHVSRKACVQSARVLEVPIPELSDRGIRTGVADLFGLFRR